MSKNTTVMAVNLVGNHASGNHDIRVVTTLAGSQVDRLDALAVRLRPHGVKLTRALLVSMGVHLALNHYETMADDMEGK